MFKLSSKKSFYLLFVLFILFPSVILNYSFLEGNIPNSSINITVLADSTPDVDLGELPDIPYEYLNEMWYDPKIEMLIITPENEPYFEGNVTQLMEWKNTKGVKTIILNNYSLYGDGDTAENIRDMIKFYYERENIKWVLLCGDAQDDLIPIRYVYNPDTTLVAGTSEYSSWNETHKPTDFYYADLTGSWNGNGNDEWGESAYYTGNIDEISWTPDVYVGRLPADTGKELGEMVNKTLKYETNPEIGNWTGQMLLAGGISDTPAQEPPDGEDEARLTTFIWQHYTQYEMNFTHLVNSNPTYDPPGTTLPLTQANFNDSLTSGYSTIIFAGHAQPDRFSDQAEPLIYDLSDARKSNNVNMPSLIYADACTTSPFDQFNTGPQNDDNIGEVLIKQKDSGAIGYIGGLRVTWYFTEDHYLEKLNRGNAKLFWEEFFENKKYQQGKALYDSKVSYMNSDYFERGETSMTYEWERKNILSYCLLGDPEVDIYTNKPAKVSDPFTQDIYEGQLITSTIKDINGKTVPYARVHLNTSDGKYRTVYGDINGIVSFRLPAQADETYNVTITGHNLIPSYFNFITLSDISKPEFIDEDCTPEEPTVSDNICFDIEVHDSQSGIENVYLLKSKDDDFEKYTYYKMIHRFEDDKDDFKYTINKLDPGEYYFLVVARDWANNKEILEDKSFEISIPIPIMDYLLIISLLMIIAVAGISVIIAYNGNKKYSHTFTRLELTKN